jgi:hypothetical protein
MNINTAIDYHKYKILKFELKCQGSIELTVNGISMLPALLPDDKINIETNSNYKLGDILVFFYGGSGLIVHRLLLQRKGRFFLKGDNSFALEETTGDSILGKVASIQRDNRRFIPPLVDKGFITSSLEISSEFIKCGYNAEKVMQTRKYLVFANSYLIGKDFVI